MTERFTLVHLSDLHFAGGRYKSSTHLVHSIPRLRGIERALSSVQADRVLVTGDLSDRGDADSLLNAKDWLLRKLDIGDDERIGLELPASRLGVIPGNHDAYGSSRFDPKLSFLDCWQSTLELFNRAFPEHRFDKQAKGCRYDWIQKGDRGIYIVYLDTCYLGDDDNGEYSNSTVAQLLSRIARGGARSEQATQMLAWWDLGTHGKLSDPNRAGEFISAEVFKSSLKIVVAHHYLFEPKGARRQPMLQMTDPKAVFGNLASAEFDIYLAGHKHYSDFQPGNYLDHCDQRARSRFLMNIYRKLVGLAPQPMPMKDENGRQLAGATRLFIFMTAVREKLQLQWSRDIESVSSDTFHEFCEHVAKCVENGLDDPTRAAIELKTFIRTGRIDVSSAFDISELREIESHLLGRLSASERQKLKPAALEVARLMRRLAMRPFVQIMSGSSAKRAANDERDPAKLRSFNIYNISANSDGFTLEVVPLFWNHRIGEFEPRPALTQSFADVHRRVHP